MLQIGDRLLKIANPAVGEKEGTNRAKLAELRYELKISKLVGLQKENLSVQVHYFLLNFLICYSWQKLHVER